MKNIEFIFLDLDGTITEPFDGITKSVQYSLTKFGIAVDDRRALKPFIGPPLKNAYMKEFSLSEEDALKAVEYYREYYKKDGMYDCVLYEGIPEFLKKASSKYKLVLATSKPQPFAEKILEKFDLKKYFYHIVGATFDDKISEKTDVIKKALSDLSLKGNRCIMIGDRCYDIEGAKDHGLYSAGVTYGYGEESEFATADLIFRSVEEMYKYFCI